MDFTAQHSWKNKGTIQHLVKSEAIESPFGFTQTYWWQTWDLQQYSRTLPDLWPSSAKTLQKVEAKMFDCSFKASADQSGEPRWELQCVQVTISGQMFAAEEHSWRYFSLRPKVKTEIRLWCFRGGTLWESSAGNPLSPQTGSCWFWMHLKLWPPPPSSVCWWEWQRTSGENKSHNSSNQQRREELQVSLLRGGPGGDGSSLNAARNPRTCVVLCFHDSRRITCSSPRKPLWAVDINKYNDDLMRVDGIKLEN